MPQREFQIPLSALISNYTKAYVCTAPFNFPCAVAEGLSSERAKIHTLSLPITLHLSTVARECMEKELHLFALCLVLIQSFFQLHGLVIKS